MPATCHNTQIAAELLGLPDEMRCDFILSFGYPADAVAAHGTRIAPAAASPLDSIVREEHW